MHEQMTRLYLAAEKLTNTVGQSAVARLLNESPQTLKNWESRGVSKSGTIKAQQIIGCNVTWLMTGIGRMGQDDPKADPIDLDNHPELVPVRTVKLRLQAGVTGFSIEADQNDGPPIFFRSDWLAMKGYKHYNLVAVKVAGRSMETTLFAGDMVVVNTASTEPKDGKVFAVNHEGEAVIKRMSRDAGVWWLTSDNADKIRFPNKECTEGSCIIVGEVIHRQSEQI